MTNKLTLLFFLSILVFFTACGDAEKAADTTEESKDKMADFADDKDFRDKHPAPNNADFTPQGEMMTYDTPDGKTASAYMLKAAEPTDKYLFVIQEWWGLNNNIKREADRYFNALENVNVMALDMYDGKSADNPDEAGKLMQSREQERLENIVKGALNYAGEEPEIATVGWCFGGGWSLRSAILAGEDAKACVMYYGMPVENAAQLAPLEAPVLGLFAEKDEWINREVISKFEKLAAATNKDLETHWFEADHAFANPSNPNYNSEAAQKANAMAMDFIKKNF